MSGCCFCNARASFDNMQKELIVIRLIQWAIALNTVLFTIGIVYAKLGKITIHRRINSLTALTTIIGVLGLVVTVLLGWDYSQLTTPDKMLIHRCFSHLLC